MGSRSARTLSLAIAGVALMAACTGESESGTQALGKDLAKAMTDQDQDQAESLFCDDAREKFESLDEQASSQGDGSFTVEYVEVKDETDDTATVVLDFVVEVESPSPTTLTGNELGITVRKDDGDWCAVDVVSADRSGEEAISGGPLEGLTGADVCDMVDHATFEEQLGYTVRDATGLVDETSKVAAHCRYLVKTGQDSDDEDSWLSLSVREGLESASTVQEALDAYFLDGFGGETAPYEKVDGLGEAAGYISSEENFGIGDNHLVAILKADGGYIELVARSAPEGSIDQLRPIVDELIKGAQAGDLAE